MQRRANYIATRKDNDKFYALDRENIITTWDAINGKLLKQNRIQHEFDFSNFTQFGLNNQKLDMTYAREWSLSRSLIISNDEAKERINTGNIS